MIKFVATKLEKHFLLGSGLFSYFGYGFYNNNGLRKIIKNFVKKWPVKCCNNRLINVHVDGEVYMRTALIEDISENLLDLIGFQRFKLTYSPVWNNLEFLIFELFLDKKEQLKNNLGFLAAKTIDKKKKNDLRVTIKKQKKEMFVIKCLIALFRRFVAKPLYRSANLECPEVRERLYELAQIITPTLKPRGEFPVYIGEVLHRLKEDTDLFLNVAPEGCMVGMMAETLTPALYRILNNKQKRIQSLFSLNGEIDTELLILAVLKTMGLKKYYTAL